MSKSVTFAPILSVLALAGSPDAAKHAAFADVTRGAVKFLAHGTRNVLSDTRDALATLKGAQAKRCASFIDTVFAACDVDFSGIKGRRTELQIQPVADAIVKAAITAYEASESAATVARKAKAAETKAKTEKAAKVAAAALKAAAKSVEPAARVLTLADALDMVRAACVAGDAEARDGVVSIVGTFMDVAITA